VTFAQGVLRLVRAAVGSTLRESRLRLAFERSSRESRLGAGPGSRGRIQDNCRATSDAFSVELFAADELPAEPKAELSRLEPGFSDIEAAVALVEAGLATRVVLTGFPSWPGLLWQGLQAARPPTRDPATVRAPRRPRGHRHHEGYRRQWLNSGPCGPKMGDRRVVVDRPHARYFRYLGLGCWAKLEAQRPDRLPAPHGHDPRAPFRPPAFVRR